MRDILFQMKKGGIGMKKVVIFALFFSCVAHGMDKKTNKMLCQEWIKLEKQKAIDSGERNATADFFIANNDRIVFENGFDSDERKQLNDINHSLQATIDRDDNKKFTAFYKTARFATVLLRTITTYQPKAEPLYLEQLFCLGKLSTLAAKIKIDKMYEENFREAMQCYYVADLSPALTVTSPFEKKHDTSAKKKKNKKVSTMIIAEVPKAEFKAHFANNQKKQNTKQEKNLEEGLED